MTANYLLKQKSMVAELEYSFKSNNLRSTIIDMQKNYINDTQICLTSVSFVPENISKQIFDKVINPLKVIAPEHHYFSTESLHLTIKNIRTANEPALFDENDIQKVDKLYKQIIPQFKTIEFEVEDVLLFPTSVSVMAYASDDLQKLVLALDEGLKSIGIPDNKKYISDTIFWGNITVCRFTQTPSNDFIEAVKSLRHTKIGKFDVSEVNLITCNSVCEPESRKEIGEYNLS